MPDELYSRQRQLDLYIPGDMAVIGVGGIGSWVAILSAMSGIPRLYLYDPDILEESNRNRLPYCQSSINRPKVDVCADYIRGIRPEVIVYPINARVTEPIIIAQIQACHPVIIDCTDSPKTQIMLYNTCKKHNNVYIRAGYDGTHITVTSVVSGWIPKDIEEETYEVNPSWVVPAVVVAALAVGKAMRFPQQEVGLDISEIGIPVLERQKKVTARCFQGQAGEAPAEAARPRTPRTRRATTTRR